MNALMVIALKEIRDGIRNRWVISCIVVLALLAVSQLLLGSAPGGSLKADPMAVTVVSLSSLSVYLIPLIALMLSFDALIGEFERGTMLLLLTYPVKRWQIIIGKFIGHLAILTIAVLIGYGLTGVTLGLSDNAQASGVMAYMIMMGSSLLLGAVFIGLGYLISVVARERSSAVAYAIAVWLIFVVLYDMMLLGIIVADETHSLNPQVFSMMLLASPTDVYRIINLTAVDSINMLTGMSALSGMLDLNTSVLILIMTAWVMIPMIMAGLVFNRRQL